jgi:hypothetical protein
MKLAPTKVSTALILALAATPTVGAGTPAREYMASMHESKWTVSQEDDHCLLQHQIPGLGNTMLRQGKNVSLSFELHITQDVSLGSQCQVVIGPPPWRHGISSQSLGTIKLVPGAEHLQAKGGAAQKIYHGLEAGMMTSFSCTSVRVVISPVRYLIALPEFQSCVNSLASKKKPSPKKAKKPAKKTKKK